MIKGFVGTYDAPTSQGVYDFTFDETTGVLHSGSNIIDVHDAKCVDLMEDKYLIITLTQAGRSGIGIVELESMKLVSTYTEEEHTPCFITNRNGLIYTANYHDGNVNIYRIVKDKLTLVRRIDIKIKAGCHQVVFYNNYLIVPCLLLDEVQFFDETNNYECVKIIYFTAGAGPRHGLFNKSMNKFYLVSELSSELYIFDVDKLTFNLHTKIQLLPQEVLAYTNTAAILLSDDEKFIYISSRGADVLTVIQLDGIPKIMQAYPTEGKHPRDMMLSPDGRFLVVAYRDTNNLISYAIDKESGVIEGPVSEISVPKGIGIALIS